MSPPAPERISTLYSNRTPLAKLLQDKLQQHQVHAHNYSRGHRGIHHGLEGQEKLSRRETEHFVREGQQENIRSAED